MFAGKRILALIPARGGSKGIKGKNIVDLCGKPLISYTIIHALRSKYIDRVIVSTDNEAIAKVAREYGADVPFTRPDELASDTAKTIDVVLHAIDFFGDSDEQFDILVLLQPTQPLRTVKDIDESIRFFFDNGQRGLVSVSSVDDHPLLIRTINDSNELSTMLKACSTCRRQDMPEYYRVNGCIYINRVDEIDQSLSFNDNSIGFIMEKSHSVDIDEEKDLIMAEYYLKQRMVL